MMNNNSLEKILRNSNFSCSDPNVERLKIELREERPIFASVPIYQKKLVNQYTFFKNNIYNPKKVLYACCGIDGSPSKIFPDVTFVDDDEEVVTIMKNYRIPIIMKDIRQFNPKEKYDLSIIINPVLASRHLVKNLADKSYVLSNDLQGNARQLIMNKDFEFLGTLDKNKNGEIYLNEGDKSKLGKFLDLHVFKKNGKTTT